jgi:predicted heme/steroid binding protein
LKILLEEETLKEITLAQLALRNGTDKPEIWCSFKGLVYDLTLSKLWRNGKHYEHWAGQDLTKELADAPHTDTVFDKFKVVGKLKDYDRNS